MSNTKLYLIAAICIPIAAISCKKDDAQPLKLAYSSLTTSTLYTDFKDADGLTSVDFLDQKQCLDMFVELNTYMSSSKTQVIDAAVLKNMYANTNSPFVGANKDELNAASSKKLKDKTAESFTVADAEAARVRIETMFDQLAILSQSYNKVAADGQAGLIGTTSKYLVDANGIEWQQVIAKSLLGSVMLDQIVNGCLGDEKQAVDNNSLVAGKNYTQLEHNWDEAYGWLTSNPKYPTLKADGVTKDERALGSYAYQDNTSEEATAKTAELYLAFLKGRAAVVNKDSKTREAQIALIRASLEKTLAKVTVSYLWKAQDFISQNDFASAAHALGEGAGFLYSLRFAHNAKVNTALSDQLLAQVIGGSKGLYSLTPAILTNVRQQIASKFGINPDGTTTH